jgi:hypothetical protein
MRARIVVYYYHQLMPSELYCVVYSRPSDALVGHGHHDFAQRLVLVEIQIQDRIFVQPPFIV